MSETGQELMRRALTAVGEVMSDYTTHDRAMLHFALVVWKAGDPSDPVFGAGGARDDGLAEIHAETREAIKRMAETIDEHKVDGA
jgi:hypothetical protein